MGKRIFKILPHTHIDKDFKIETPLYNVDLYADYDDVNHLVVDALTEVMVELLNEHKLGKRIEKKIRKFAAAEYDALGASENTQYTDVDDFIKSNYGFYLRKEGTNE